MECNHVAKISIRSSSVNVIVICHEVAVICHFPKGKNDNDDTSMPVIEMHKMTQNDKMTLMTG